MYKSSKKKSIIKLLNNNNNNNFKGIESFFKINSILI
jgi:hypothetical protein